MTFKKGDRFLIEVEYVREYSGNPEWGTLKSNGSVDFNMPKCVLVQAQKIEPEYETGEWYLCKGWIDSKVEPWLYNVRTFETIGAELNAEDMHWIGPKIDRPEE